MKKIILSAIMLAGAVTFAQEEQTEKAKPALTISGTVDVYGTTEFTKGYKGTPGLLTDNKEPNGFGLGMANTVFSYGDEKSGLVADLAFGPRGNASVGANNINQLYAYYNVNDKLTLTVGQFNTFVGYEVISPAGNFNYTTSYLFNAGPFSHIAAKFEYAASEDLSFLLSVGNPHNDLSGSSVSGDAQLGAQIGYKGQFLNVLYGNDGSGADDELYVDYTGGFDITEALYVGINAAYNNNATSKAGYQGAALYIENAITETLSIGIRPEFYQTTFDGDAVNDQIAATLSANKSLTENLKLIAEVRYDENEVAVYGAEENVTSVTVAAVYSF